MKEMQKAGLVYVLLYLLFYFCIHKTKFYYFNLYALPLLKGFYYILMQMKCYNGKKTVYLGS